MKGQNHHHWLNAQYGLKKLMEHIWTVVGMAAACKTTPELREKMAERYGKVPIQLTLYLDPPKNELAVMQVNERGRQLRRPYLSFTTRSISCSAILIARSRLCGVTPDLSLPPPNLTSHRQPV